MSPKLLYNVSTYLLYLHRIKNDSVMFMLFFHFGHGCTMYANHVFLYAVSVYVFQKNLNEYCASSLLDHFNRLTAT